MKEFFKDPINIIAILIVLAFICFTIAAVASIYGMMVDHYCTYEISITEAMNTPQCKPYLKYLIK